MCALDEQGSKVSVNGLGDSQLWIVGARLAKPRPETQKTPRITALSELVLVFQRKYECEHRQGNLTLRTMNRIPCR